MTIYNCRSLILNLLIDVKGKRKKSSTTHHKRQTSSDHRGFNKVIVVFSIIAVVCTIVSDYLDRQDDRESGEFTLE